MLSVGLFGPSVIQSGIIGLTLKEQGEEAVGAAASAVSGAIQSVLDWIEDLAVKALIVMAVIVVIYAAIREVV